MSIQAGRSSPLSCRRERRLFEHSQLLADPLARAEGSRLTLETARCYASRAVELAETIGDAAELIEACHVLGQHHHLTANFEEARTCGQRIVVLARQIRNLRHEEMGCRLLGAVAQMEEPGNTSQLPLIRRQAELQEQLGDIPRLISTLLVLTRAYIFDHELQAAAATLERAARAIDSIPESETDLPRSRSHAAGNYHRCCAILRQAEGRPADAAAELHLAIAGNFGHPRYRAYGLAEDVAWLESLYRLFGDQAGFAGFCTDLQRADPSPMQQWHLIAAAPPPLVGPAEPLPVRPTSTGSWQWTDPLGKGRCIFDNGTTITPVMGTGFLSNVYIPRLTRKVGGDFAFETVIDWDGNRTRAGGILVYQDDQTLVRFGAGIQFDSDITLTVKSADQGLRIVARGLLCEGDTTTLRLERRGERFLAWCSDGTDWFSCGEAELAMDDEIDVGLFVECTYRDSLSPVRCTDTPVSFTQTRLHTHGSTR